MEKYKRMTNKKIDIDNLSDKAKSRISDTYLEYAKMNNALWELENKIENGTLIELPCRVGDTVYVLCKGDYVLVGEKTGWEYTIKKLKSTLSTFSIWEYGRTLFLTQAEAEKKVKELKGEV